MQCEQRAETKRKGLAMCDARKNGRSGRDQRFKQLLALAQEGDEDAAGDLYREYGFEYGRDEA